MTTAHGTAARTVDGDRRPLVLLIDLDAALAGLLSEWLERAGLRAALADPDGQAAPVACDLAVVDIPFPRLGGYLRLQQLAQGLPGTPILVLSPTFFAGVEARGAVARQLGVAGVLATPVGRDTLLAEVRALLAACASPGPAAEAAALPGSATLPSR